MLGENLPLRVKFDVAASAYVTVAVGINSFLTGLLGAARQEKAKEHQNSAAERR